MKTQEEIIAIIRPFRQAVLKACMETAGDLACRWEDEKEFEDIKDYGPPLQALLPAGCTFVKMTKRPFGFTFRIDSVPNLIHHFKLRKEGNYFKPAVSSKLG